MSKPNRSVIVDGNCFWMEADSEGGYLFGAPMQTNGEPDFHSTFELDSRAFKTRATFENFRESVRFLLTYERS